MLKLFLLGLVLFSCYGQKLYHQPIEMYETSLMRGNMISLTLTDFRAAFNLTYLSFDKISLCNFSMGYTSQLAYAEQNFLIRMNFSDFVAVENDLYIISRNLTILKYRVDTDVSKLLFLKSYQINGNSTYDSRPKGYFTSFPGKNQNILYVIDGMNAYALDVDTGESTQIANYSKVGDEKFRDFEILVFPALKKQYLFIAAGDLGIYVYEIGDKNLIQKMILKEKEFGFNFENINCVDLIIDGDFLYVMEAAHGIFKFKINENLEIKKVDNFLIDQVGGDKFSKFGNIFLSSKFTSEKRYYVQEIIWNEATSSAIVNREFQMSEKVNHLAIGPTVSIIIGEVNNIQFLTGINKNMVKEESKIVTNFYRKDIQEVSILNFFDKNEDYLTAVTPNSVFLYKITYPNPVIKCISNSSTPITTYPFMISFLTRDCKNKTLLNDTSILSMCNNSMPFMLKVYETPQEVEDNSLKVGLGVGLTFGIIFLIIFIVIMYYCWKRQQKQFKKFEDDGVDRRGKYQGGIANQE